MMALLLSQHITEQKLDEVYSMLEFTIQSEDLSLFYLVIYSTSNS